MVKALNWIKNEIWTGYSVFEKLYLISMLLLQIGPYKCVLKSRQNKINI